MSDLEIYRTFPISNDGHILLHQRQDDWHGYKESFRGEPIVTLGSWIEFNGLKACVTSGHSEKLNGMDHGEWVFETEDGIKITLPESITTNGFHESMTKINRPLEVGDWVVDQSDFCATVSEVRKDGVFIEQNGEVKFVSRESVRRIKPPESATDK